jgi:hypothetical protein
MVDGTIGILYIVICVIFAFGVMLSVFAKEKCERFDHDEEDDLDD